MKTFYSTEAQTEILFARNQRNLSLADARCVYSPESGYHELIGPAFERLAVISGIGDTLASKIKSWCVKNSYRCSGVRQFEQFKAGAL
jgi:hypothetical protein